MISGSSRNPGKSGIRHGRILLRCGARRILALSLRLRAAESPVRETRESWEKVGASGRPASMEMVFLCVAGARADWSLNVGAAENNIRPQM
jgi:hypothetical protein